jgi:hypothetical protein
LWKKLNEILEKLLWFWIAIGFRSQHQVTLDCYSRGGGKGKSQQAQKKGGISLQNVMYMAGRIL